MRRAEGRQSDGGQFFWALSPDACEPERRFASTSVRSTSTTASALYDPHGHLIGSVQAMPGYHNKLDLTLNEAGVYRILCFEFCGVNHSTMQSTFTVTPH